MQIFLCSKITFSTVDCSLYFFLCTIKQIVQIISKCLRLWIVFEVQMSLGCKSGNTFHEFIRPNRAIALFCCFPFVVKKFFLTGETYIRSGLCVFYIRRQTALFKQTIRFRTYVVIILRPRIVRTDFLRYIFLNTIITVIFTFFRTLIKQVQTHIFPRSKLIFFRLLRSVFSVFKKWFFKFS